MTLKWQSRTWVRRLGWTALYGLLYGGAYFGAPFHGSWWWIPHLGGLALAFFIGVRFRSRLWVLGPPVVIILGFVAVIVIDILQSFVFTEEPWTEAQSKGAEIALGMLVAFSFIPLMLSAGVFALAAASGVEVGKRRSGRLE